MTTDERRLVETAMDLLNSTDANEIVWPPVARRVREARERLGLTESEVASRLEIQDSEYWDVEFHDDEAFTSFSVEQLKRLADILGVSLRALFFGDDSNPSGERTSFASITQRLQALAASERLSTDELSERVGWELEEILTAPESLGELNVAGLRDVCMAIGVDWTTALPAPG
jgi:transcriptional regulator with XRE-family HTH domain